MKRLLAIILAWLTAFYNNVDYVEPPNNQGYQPGNYFVLETGESRPDYKTNTKSTNSLDSKSVCTTTNFTADKYSKSADSLRIDSDKTNNYGYWWQASTPGHECDLGSINTAATTISIEAGAVIIAPTKCTRTTASDTVQSYPVAMTLEMSMDGVDYVVTITGLRCWACDMFRTLNEVDGVPVIVHTYTESSHNYSKGDVLGLAADGCQIQVLKRNAIGTSPATVADFYGK